MKKGLIVLLVSVSGSMFSQNPVISQRYTADPTGLEYDGRLYLWTSHDIHEQKRYWMNDITCVSTDDMQNYTDHGEVFKAPDDMPWVTQAWAPSVVEKNGKFYLYTGDGNRSVNVSVSNLNKHTVNGVKKYYFSYFTNVGTGMNIDYMMSDNPMTGWEYKGTVLKQPSDNYNNSHASIFSFKNNWYLGYHTRKIATDRKVDENIALRQRSVSVDALYFNEDGTIKEVIATKEGPKQIKHVNPFQKNEAETMAAQSYLLPGINTAVCNDSDGGRMVIDIESGDWIKIAGVDFNDGAHSFEARISAQNNGTIEIRLGNKNGQLLGTCNVSSTGSLKNWNTVSCNVKNIKGVHDLYFKFTGQGANMFNFNWWAFKN